MTLLDIPYYAICFRRFIFLLQGCNISQFHYAGGRGGAWCCLFGETCLPGKWPELPSLLGLDKCLWTKWKQFVQLFHPSEAGPWDCTQLGSSPRCQFALIKCNRESAVARIEKHFQQNEKTVPGPVLSTQRYLCSNFHTIKPWQHRLTIWWDIDHFAVMLI